MENVPVQKKDYRCWFCPFSKKMAPYFHRQQGEEEPGRSENGKQPGCTNGAQGQWSQGNGEQRNSKGANEKR